MPGGMVRTCSLSRILFPRASALHKIVINIHFSYIFFVCSFKYIFYVARLPKQTKKSANSSKTRIYALLY
ncbi:hypothetical protein BU073_10280 [Mammaliicoccus vitulinus]|uniref:Uncharacterized protein n=1 Tax=Mammaliicoccus vitulinus TaxID=71237 RepID=A0A2T4PRI9_9STAP|nr:hypothetical protein BU072_10795 [Mammaliicoccus vitulinus]PTI37586.1 hypothetical protein BU074_04755 [Mammaliicoccus vitulinus]PTI70445.1 hypothetical protein BU073_10280 [Mammaliicoccus vitulinus]RIN24718.1 hypothetical protein BU070_02835 [Mammaliicoccus vitulinus]